MVLGELEQDHTGQNGFPADVEGGPDSSPPNVHLRSLRLESTAHNQFNRSGFSSCSLLTMRSARLSACHICMKDPIALHRHHAQALWMRRSVFASLLGMSQYNSVCHRPQSCYTWTGIAFREP